MANARETVQSPSNSANPKDNDKESIPRKAIEANRRRAKDAKAAQVSRRPIQGRGQVATEVPMSPIEIDQANSQRRPRDRWEPKARISKDN